MSQSPRVNPGPGAIPHSAEGSQKNRTGLTRELAQEKDEDEASWGSRHIVLWMSVTKLNTTRSHFLLVVLTFLPQLGVKK